MAWVTTLGPAMAQIDYRLQEQSGCSLSVGDDNQVEYRLESDRPLEWVGEGLREVGIEPGTVLDDAGKQAAMALADGRDPRTGDVLVAPKMAVDPRAKLDAGPLVDAVRAAAERSGTTPGGLLSEPRMVARYGRLQRGVARERARTGGLQASGLDAGAVPHRAPVGDLEKVADAAGIALDDVYGADDLASARKYRDARVAVGNRGYDVTLDLPKSYSVLTAMAGPELAAQLEDVYLDAVRETVTAMQSWAGYGMRGHHGDGERGVRVDGTGLLGWMTVHRTARPVPGATPDPHLHAHVTFVNMVRGTDGKWSTVGAGGRDFHRHARAADGLVKARLRQVTRERWGIEWARDPDTGAWEVAAVPKRLSAALSKRHGQVERQLRKAGIDPDTASTGQQKLAASRSKEAKLAPGASVDLRADWHAQAAQVGVDPAGLVAAAMPGPNLQPPVVVPADVLAEWVFRPEKGLTAHRKTVTRAGVLAEVLDADGTGVASLAAAEKAVDAVLVDELAVPLPAGGARHLSNSQRYSTTEIVDAERAVLGAARDRYAGGYATVPDGTLDLAVAQFEAGAGFTLSGEQRAVLTRLATAGHGVDTVIGVAGSGKTTLMSALRSAYEATGKVVAGASTAGVAVENLTAEAGIASRTIASWLARIDTGQGLAGVDVLVIDEAAMVDDRHLARLLTAAGAAGTKVIGIGDPKQLKAVGVGGTFAAVHTMVNGLSLTENRRQRDDVERQALAVWRADQRRAALQTWADTGRVHVTGTPEQAHEAMLTRWVQARTEWADPHDRIERLLMLAHTNADVTALNALAQQHRHANGELGQAARYALRTGGELHLHVGDQVMTRTTDRAAGVLNGQRGMVVDVDEHTGRLTIERRRLGPDGPELIRLQVARGYVHDGGVQLAYAITASKAQGLTSDRALIYGNRMDAHVLYPAMSRDRHRADLWLALDPLETDADRARQGAPDSDAEARHRAVTAYTAAVENDRPDSIVLAELGETPDPIVPAAEAGPAPTAEVRRGVDPVVTAAQQRPAVTNYAELRAYLDTIPDEQLRQLTRREELRKRLQDAARSRPDREQHAQQRRDAAYGEIRALLAGEAPSGRFSRDELQAATTAAEAEAARRQSAAIAARVQQTRRDIDQALTGGARAETVPVGATTGLVPWQQRPYGKVPTEQLAARIDKAEQAIERLAAAEAERQRVTEQRIADARAGRGPAMRELEEHRAQLQAAVDAARQIEQCHRQADAERAKARAARDEIHALQDAERNRGRLAKMLRPAGDDLTRRVDELRDTAVRADHDGGRAAGAAYPHEQIVRRTPNAADRLTKLESDWPTRAAEAMRADEHPPRTAASIAAQSFPPRRSESAEQLQRRVAGLRDEAALRDRMDPVQLLAEDTSRAVARVTAAANRPAPEHDQAPDHGYDYNHSRRPHIDRDHGPSLGM